MDTKKLPLSAIVLTLNEQHNISACLSTLCTWVDEVFVVDSGSTDRTLEIAQEYTCNIVHHEFENYSRQRNWSQNNLPIKHDWVFHVDADERVTPELIDALTEFFTFERHVHPDVTALLVRRRIRFLGRDIVHGGIYPTYHCRVFQRKFGQCEDRDYDQHFIVSTGDMKQIEADLVEVTATSLFSWTSRHNRWAKMEALYLQSVPQENNRLLIGANLSGSPIERRRWLRSSAYERMPLFSRAVIYFFLRYIVRGGFLDGIPGLIYHVLHGFWFRFYIDACLYEAKIDKLES
ncbi:MAG: glycosyltransferase family 2 protein [Chloroflexota bacterium]